MKTKPFISIILPLVAAFGFAGCMSVGSKFDPTKVSRIKRGVTTQAEMIAMFGEPNQRGVDITGAPSLDWYYQKIQVKPQSFIPVVGLIAGGAKSDNRSLHVTLGANGKVKDFSANAGSM